MKNSISFLDLRSMPPSEIAELDIDTLEIISAEIKETESILKGAKQLFNQAIIDKYAEYQGTGTKHYIDNGWDIKVVKPIRPSWDQEKLADLAAVIREDWKEDPSEFIEMKLSVKESKLKSWPSSLAAHFTPARTEKQGAPQITITPAGE